MLGLIIAAGLQGATCEPPEGYADVSAHLEAIREADQADRRERIDGRVMLENDRARRAHVDGYMDGGCLTTGRDHHNAALIHQHGGSPEDYRTAFELAVRAVELGDEEAAWLIPRAIDRYYMRQGYKQLYATNSRGFPREDGEGFIMCLWPSVAEITDSDRQALGERTEAEQLAWVAEMNGEEEGRICDVEAEDPPRGTFEGYW